MRRPGSPENAGGKGPRLDSPPARPGDHILDHPVLASAPAAPAGNAKKPFAPKKGILLNPCCPNAKNFHPARIE